MGGCTLQVFRVKMRPMVRKILNHPWIVCSHPLTLLSVLRHLWPCGWSQEGPEASLHLSGELASDGPHQAHRSRGLGLDHTVLLRAPLQRGATAVFVSFSLPSVKQNYGVRATGQQCTEAGDICAICQAEFREPLVLMCQVSRSGGTTGDGATGPQDPAPYRSPRCLSSGHTSGLWTGPLGTVWSGLGSVRSKYKTQFCLFPAGCLGAGYFTTLSLGFISKM